MQGHPPGWLKKGQKEGQEGKEVEPLTLKPDGIQCIRHNPKGKMKMQAVSVIEFH